jgi:hypothetical protein
MMAVPLGRRRPYVMMRARIIEMRVSIIIGQEGLLPAGPLVLVEAGRWVGSNRI